MDRQIFAQRLATASRRAAEFARRFLEETLPADLLFRVHLNESYDGNATPEFVLFPEDSSDAAVVQHKDVGLDDALEVLWRDGMVPQWVNLTVAAETGSATVIDVVACGRFTADESLLYHQQEGFAPFHVLGPTLPIGYKDGDTFSIYRDAACWSATDLDRVSANAEKVWSLELNGPVFTDELLLGGFEFPAAEILEVRGGLVQGNALAMLNGIPKLRVLRLSFGSAELLDLSALPRLSGLESLELVALPPLIRGLAGLSRRLPRLSSLRLGSGGRVEADDALSFGSLDRLTLEFPTIPAWIPEVPRVDSLSLHIDQCSDLEASRLIASAASTLRSVGLRGTPVTDGIFETLGRLSHLGYVDLVDTGVTPEALSAFAGRRPSLKYYPRAPR